MWQTIRIYTRRTAEVDGHPLYSELTRRLREAGAAGATTILGEWGFSSDEPPHGDKLGRVSSHRPTYSVCIDRPARIAEVWPVIDELTVEHGIVTSWFVPGYRERAGDTAHGSLRVAERLARLADEQRAAAPAPSEDAVTPAEAGAAASGPWVQALLARVERFGRDRGVNAPVVRVTLEDGERFFLYAVEPGPGVDFVTLHPHPERYREMIAPAEGERLPPRALMVPLIAIAKLELLYAATARHAGVARVPRPVGRAASLIGSGGVGLAVLTADPVAVAVVLDGPAARVVEEAAVVASAPGEEALRRARRATAGRRRHSA